MDGTHFFFVFFRVIMPAVSFTIFFFVVVVFTSVPLSRRRQVFVLFLLLLCPWALLACLNSSRVRVVLLCCAFVLTETSGYTVGQARHREGDGNRIRSRWDRVRSLCHAGTCIACVRVRAWVRGVWVRVRCLLWYGIDPANQLVAQ